MEYDVFRIDRRISQAYKTWYVSQGPSAMSWRASIAQLLLREAGLIGEHLPEAPAKLPPGRPETYAARDMSLKVAQKQAKEKEKQGSRSENFDKILRGDSALQIVQPKKTAEVRDTASGYQWDWEESAKEEWVEQLKPYFSDWQAARKAAGNAALDWQSFLDCLNNGEIEYAVHS